MEQKNYDVIIAGAGPAGTTAATLLAQYGHSVLLIERDQHPLSAPDGMIVSRRRREICQSEVRDSARGRLKFYPE